MFCYQIVIEVWFKRCLVRLQKGVSKSSKGHLLQAKRALIESQLTPFYFSDFDFSLQNRVADAIGDTKKGSVYTRNSSTSHKGYLANHSPSPPGEGAGG